MPTIGLGDDRRQPSRTPLHTVAAIANFPLVGPSYGSFTRVTVMLNRELAAGPLSRPRWETALGYADPALEIAAPLGLYLLGGFRAERVDLVRPVCEWPRRSAKTLTKLLAVHPGHALHREQILDILWPGLDLESALNSFGKALHAARRALEPELLPRKSSQYLQLTDFMLSLNADRVVIDADCFQQQAEDALRRREVTAYETALAAYGGELLPEDRYEDWCAERRSLLSELHVRLLLGLAEAHEAGGIYNEAADRLREALAEDETREEIHRRLMRVYAEMGVRDQALRQFHLCQDVLRRELDLAPQQETVSLYQELLEDRVPRGSTGGESESVSSGPPLAADRASGKPLIGRNQVLRYLHEQLVPGKEARAGLILMTGESGVGKTRLLEEFAAEAGQRGAAVLWGGSGAHANDFIYGPFAVALEGYVASRSEAERKGIALRYPALARSLPSLPMDREATRAVDPYDDLAPAIARLLTDLGRTQPVLLVLGDVEDTDCSGLDLLRYIAHLAIARPWLILGALREEEVDTRAEYHRAVDAMVRERLCVKIELQCLSHEDCGQFVAALLSEEHVEDKLVELIYGRSRGNPLYVEALVHEMQENGKLAGRHSEMGSSMAPPAPARVRALVTTRLAGLDETVRRVLSLAAAARAAEISLTELRAGAAALHPPVSDSMLFDALDRALQIGLLEERKDGYTFRHPLVRSALYEELSRHRRAELRTALGRPRGGSSRRLRVAAT